MELTPEIKQFAELVAINAIREYNPTVKKDKRYKLSDPIIKATFPSLSKRILQSWCAEKKIGIFGRDGKHHVTLEEIERYAFPPANAVKK